jgi:branched-chain amino acid transport system permease protein
MERTQQASNPLAQLVEWFSSPPVSGNWLYRFIIYPLLQMVVFIIGIAVFLTAAVYLIALIFPNPRENIVLAEQLNRQLPGMIISGISVGFVYSMIALGYTLVYGVLKFINFAHSEIFMVGSVVGFEVMQRIDEAGAIQQWNPVVMVVTIVLSAMLASGLLAVLIERVAYRPLRTAPRLVPLISAIGVSFLLTDIVRATEAMMRNDFNLRYPTNNLDWLTDAIPVIIGGITVNIKPTSIIMVVGAVLTLLALNFFVNGTKLGRGVRAVSQDQPTAGLMGIDVNFMISLTFFIGGSFGGAAGALFGMNAGTVTPYVGFIPGVKAFTAAVLGGIGNVTGSLLGGLTIGMLEAFLNGTLVYFPALGQRYTDIFVFSILIIVLIFRPGGLLGERVDEKV